MNNNNKRLLCGESASVNDISGIGRKNEHDEGIERKTRIIFKDPVTGEILHDTTNKVVIAGSMYTALKHFGAHNVKKTSSLVNFPNYNTDLGIDIPGSAKFEDPVTGNIIDSSNPYAEIIKEYNRIVVLFACGVGGCGAENSQVYPVDYSNRIRPKDMIPFRYELLSNDLSGEERGGRYVNNDNNVVDSFCGSYYGRKIVTVNSEQRAAYFYKSFEAWPTFHQRKTDGTEITASTYDNDGYPESISYVDVKANILARPQVESYMELKCKVTKSDFRDFFINTYSGTVTGPDGTQETVAGIDKARINQLSLLTGYWLRNNESLRIKGNTAQDERIYSVPYFAEVAPETLLNIPNEPLIDLTKGIDIIYQIFY